MEIKVEKQSSKYIKPSVSTPQDHRHYRISFIDEFVPVSYVSIVLFFPHNNKVNPNFILELEKSLEKTLTLFYPLAGRYIEDIKTVECNDEGVEFIHAKVNIKLQDFLVSEFKVNMVEQFIPFKTGHTDLICNPILTIKETSFECGGVAVGVRALHKIVDASTLCTFLHEWADLNRNGSHNATRFTSSFFNSSFLSPDRGFRSETVVSNDVLSKYTRKQFSFSESEILNFRTKAKYSNCKWSKVQLVAAIIWKALRHVDQAKNNYLRESVLVQPISLREKMVTLIPEHSCGNLWCFSYTRSKDHETIEELADLLTCSVKKTLNDLSKLSHDSKEGQTFVLNSLLDMGNLNNKSSHVVGFTSWCIFPFYETDFGFGKPIWVVPGTILSKNFPILIDDFGGKGVEAHVLLDKIDIPHFEEALVYHGFGP